MFWSEARSTKSEILNKFKTQKSNLKNKIEIKNWGDTLLLLWLDGGKIALQ